MENSFNNQKEFNSGLAIIYQLDAIEKQLIVTTSENINGINFENHFNLLKVYFKTLYPYMKETTKEQEKTYHKKRWLELRKIVFEIKKKARNGRDIPCYLVDSLDDWELELRDLKQKRGLGMPEKDPRYR